MSSKIQYQNYEEDNYQQQGHQSNLINDQDQAQSNKREQNFNNRRNMNVINTVNAVAHQLDNLPMQESQSEQESSLSNQQEFVKVHNFNTQQQENQEKVKYKQRHPQHIIQQKSTQNNRYDDYQQEEQRNNQYQNGQQEDQQEQYQSQREALLNFKITQLNKIIQTLSDANRKLTQKLQENYANNNCNSNNNQNENDNSQSMILNRTQGQGQQQQQNRTSSNKQNLTNNNNNNTMMFNDQFTQMQGEFNQIQQLLKQYKQQLAKTQKKWETIVSERDDEIDQLKEHIIQMTEDSEANLESLRKEKEQEIQSLKNKNEELLIEIQNLQNQMEKLTEERRSSYQAQQNQSSSASSNMYHNLQNQYLHQSPRSRYTNMNMNNHNLQRHMSPTRYPQSSYQKSNYFNKRDQLYNNHQQEYQFTEHLEKEMETMIRKLLKELEHEKKINHKLNTEVKRVTHEIIELEKKLKEKNDHIYELQMKAIQYQKSNKVGGGYLNVGLGNSGIRTPKPSSHYTPSNVTNPNINLNQNYVKNNNKTPIHTFIKSTNNNTSSRLIINQKSNETQLYHIPQTQKHEQRLTSNKNKEMKTNPRKVTRFNQTQAQEEKYGHLNPSVMSKKPSNNQPTTTTTIISVQQNNGNFKKFATSNNTNTSYSSNFNNNVNMSVSSRQFLTFTLIELQQGTDIKITLKQKIYLVSKLIDFYAKKLSNQNYKTHMAENIQICNFNEKHPNLIRIRIIHQSSNKLDSNDTNQQVEQEQQQNEETMLWNMAFIIENLIREVETVDQKNLEIDLNLVEIIQTILPKTQKEKLAYFEELARQLEKSVVE